MRGCRRSITPLLPSPFLLEGSITDPQQDPTKKKVEKARRTAAQSASAGRSRRRRRWRRQLGVSGTASLMPPIGGTIRS